MRDQSKCITADFLDDSPHDETAYPCHLLSFFFSLMAMLPEGKTFEAGADDFANAPMIDVRNGMSEPTNMAGFSLEEGEEDLELWPTEGKSAWWSWTAPSSGFCKVEAFLPPGDGVTSQGVVMVYQGNSMDTLRPPALRFGTNGPRLQTRNWMWGIGFQAVKGETYRIVVNSLIYSDAPDYSIRVRLILTPSKRVRTGLWRLVEGEGSTTDVGQVTVAVADNGRFTGKLAMRKGFRSFTGQFDEEGRATVILKRLAPGAGETKLVLDVSENGTFSLERDGMMTAGKLAEQALFTNYFPYRYDRKYSCIYAPAQDERTGTGSLYMLITKSGALRGVGTGLDGSEFTFSSHLVMTGSDLAFEAPFHLRLRGSKGAVQMTLKGFNSLDFAAPIVTGHFFRAPELGADFYPEGIDVSVDGFGDQNFGTSTGPVVSPIYTQLLTETEGKGVLIVEDAEDGYALGPVREKLTLGGGRLGLIKFDRSPLRPVLKGTWKNDTARGSIADLTGRRCPILLIRSATDYYSHKMVGLVRGRTRTYRVVVEPSFQDN